MAYEALVTKIRTRSHPNADKIQLGMASGQQVVVGLDIEDETLGVFFPPDGMLSEEMCFHNDLIRRKNPVTGKHEGGFFDENRRVRSQGFRGQKSEGYWTPLSSLAWTKANLDKLEEGDTFSDLNGYKVCEKYYTPATLRAMKKGVIRKQNDMFKKHFDTPQLKYFIITVPAQSHVYITEKLHGTSGRVARVIENKPVKRGFFSWLFRRKPKTEQVWEVLLGTRNIILDNPNTDAGFYASEDFRWSSSADIRERLHKGETVYYEIVGYAEQNSLIMSSHVTSSLPEVESVYGKYMQYTYGCSPGECEIYIYRITMTNEDNVTIELPWPQVLRRAEELKAKTVPVLDSFIYSGDTEDLNAKTEALVEGPSSLSREHIREGVCVRVESPYGYMNTYKYKSWTFGVLEGYLKDDAEYVDLEETV